MNATAMLGYYLHLALKSLRRTPGLAALMIGAIALGIAAWQPARRAARVPPSVATRTV